MEQLLVDMYLTLHLFVYGSFPQWFYHVLPNFTKEHRLSYPPKLFLCLPLGKRRFLWLVSWGFRNWYKNLEPKPKLNADWRIYYLISICSITLFYIFLYMYIKTIHVYTHIISTKMWVNIWANFKGTKTRTCNLQHVLHEGLESPSTRCPRALVAWRWEAGARGCCQTLSKDSVSKLNKVFINLGYIKKQTLIWSPFWPTFGIANVSQSEKSKAIRALIQTLVLIVFGKCLVTIAQTKQQQQHYNICRHPC